MRKVLVIVYNIERAREHEWFVEFLNRDTYEFEFALINKPSSFLHDYLVLNKIKVHTFNYGGKAQLLSLIYKLFRLIRSGHYHIIHAHLFEAALTGMIASWLAGTPNRIVTRHNSDFHHVYFPSAVKYDKFINLLATRIIAVSENVKNILINYEGVKPEKIVLIHHGVDLNDFDSANISPERISSLRKKHNIPVDKPVIGVVSRFIYWKGLQYIIPAFSKLLKQYPDAVLILANAQGPYSNQVKDLLKILSPVNYRLIEFENDISALYKTFYCFVHTPISDTAEAFGQTYIEALAARIPSVITVSGVASEYAVNGVNCLMVPYKNSDAIAEAVVRILNNEINVNSLVENGYEVVKNNYRVKDKYDKIQSLYNSFI